MTVAELETLYRTGEVVVPVDAAEPWTFLHVSRATFYRAMQRGQVPGVLTLGRRRLLQLRTFLNWLSVSSPDAKPDTREAPAAAPSEPPVGGRGQCAKAAP